MPNDIAGRFPEAAMETGGPGVESFGWRARRASGKLDGGAKRLVVIAAVIAAVLAAIVATWSVVNRRDQPVPVIEPPGGPLRVKPENRGGMQVTGLDAPMLSGESGKEKAALAPPPEMPEPQVLRSRAEAAKAKPPAPVGSPGSRLAGAISPQPPAKVSTAANAVPALPPVGPSVGKSAGVAPAGPAVAPAGPASARAPATLQVQLAALHSEAAAKAAWDRLVRQMPELFGGRSPVLERTEHDGRTFWRLRTGGFAGPAQAARFCEQVRSKRGDCAVANF